MKRAVSVAALYVLMTALQAQPSTIWLFRIHEEKDHSLTLRDGKKICGHKGYNNQPSFSSDGKSLLYACDAAGQVDVYSHKIRGEKNTRITTSQENEYSPRYVPGETSVSAVVVDSNTGQRLQLIDPVKGTTLKTIDSDSVGYYCFLNGDTLVFYKLTSPHSLRWRTLSGNKEHFLASSPHRSICRINRHAVLYGIRDSSLTHLYVYDLLLQKATFFARSLPGMSDFFWDPGLGLLASQTNKVMRYDTGTKQWKILFDLQDQGIHNISRLLTDERTHYLVVVDNTDT